MSTKRENLHRTIVDLRAVGLPMPVLLTVLLMVISAMLTSSPLRAQIPMHHSVVPPEPPDSIDSLNYYSKKHFWRASGEVVGFNIGLWAFDRYIKKGDFAYITLNSIKENFKHGFIWDNDKLGTNTFFHPYNGSLFYNAGRSNGYNFWQSELFAIGGSFMWEYFMECEYPSTNDFIATPIGGAAIGEVLFRASDALIDDRTTGAERFSREAAIFIVDPIRSFNRIVTGQAWRTSSTPGRVFGKPNFSARLSLGMKLLEFQGLFRHTHPGLAIQLDMEYGDRFEVKSTKPYDYFTVKGEMQIMRSQPFLTQFQIKGRLLARELFDNYRSRGSIGLYQHFDFYDSDTLDQIEKVPYKLGIPASLGAGFMFQDVEHRKMVFDAYAHANVVILGGILSDHYRTDERNYNWASGFSIKAGLNLVVHKDLLSLSLANEYYRLFSWRGYREGTDLARINFRTLNVQGDHSVATFNVTEARLDVRLWKRLYGTVAFNNYFRSTHYRDFPDVKSTTMSLRFMFSYKL
ncbi:MAG: DUF3943 domain-containing protein [Clostridium sp.]|nr:DUF3943 domain-containing protein [Prevotella sp.]MCM1428640.1 DUF3943 domain-containing protein [Clostridium sp.]MCM1475769.1 DUF3943 domain-containing protein [Muribaculaceae bacterium]